MESLSLFEAGRPTHTLPMQEPDSDSELEANPALDVVEKQDNQLRWLLLRRYQTRRRDRRHLGSKTLSCQRRNRVSEAKPLHNDGISWPPLSG